MLNPSSYAFDNSDEANGCFSVQKQAPILKKAVTIDLGPQDDSIQKGCEAFLPESKLTKARTKAQLLYDMRLLHYVVRHVIGSIKDFCLDKKLINFDGHVGETACHIRAFKFSLLLTTLKPGNIDEQLEKLSHLQKIYVSIIDELSTPSTTGFSEVSVLEFLLQRNLHFSLSGNIFFLTLSHCLSQHRIFNENGFCLEIDLKEFRKEVGLEKKYGKIFLNHLKVLLSQESCSFISSLYGDEHRDLLIRSDDFNRSVIPCYESTRAIVRGLIQHNIAILVVSRILNSDEKIVLLFRGTNNPIKLSNPNDIANCDLSEPCFLIRGFSRLDTPNTSADLINQITSLGIERIFLGNAALHSQYAGKKLKNFTENPYAFSRNSEDTVQEPPLAEVDITPCEREFLEMKNFALTHGLSNRNAGVFGIQHILCVTLQEILELYF